MPFRGSDYRQVIKHFSPTYVDDISQHNTSPVFRCQIENYEAILKRTTSPLIDGQGVANWVNELDKKGASVVSPLNLSVANPMACGSDVWVAYPWIDGRSYDGSSADLIAAGALLGQFHDTPIANSGIAKFVWPERDEDENLRSISEDVKGLTETLHRNAPDYACHAIVYLERFLRRFNQETLTIIRDSRLPKLPVSLDFKANNLVYTRAGPVMIDPDNGEEAPRLLDLALAVLLFHYECPTAPGRLFTSQEWQTFRDAYLTHTQLSETELALWPAALEYMLCEWGVWTVIDADTWQQPRQRAFLKDLIFTEFDRFPLPNL